MRFSLSRKGSIRSAVVVAAVAAAASLGVLLANTVSAAPNTSAANTANAKPAASAVRAQTCDAWHTLSGPAYHWHNGARDAEIRLEGRSCQLDNGTSGVYVRDWVCNLAASGKTSDVTVFVANSTRGASTSIQYPYAKLVQWPDAGGCRGLAPVLASPGHSYWSGFKVRYPPGTHAEVMGTYDTRWWYAS